jgi:hypothetical protein
MTRVSERFARRHELDWEVPISLTWAQIYNYGKQSIGEQSAWAQEAYDHLSQGYRRVCGLREVEVPELYRQTTIVLTALSPVPPPPAQPYLDYFPLDPEVYHIASLYNQTEVVPVKEEPSGMQGRERFLDGSGQPSPGSVTFFMRDGNNVYLRSTPAKDTTLIMRFGVEVPRVDNSMLNQHPITPDHYDWAIVHASVANYFSVHPDEGKEATQDSEGKETTRYQLAEARFRDVVEQPKSVYAEEAKASFYQMRLAGYRPGPRTRRAH